jgi:hypothetical protein
MKAAPSEVEFFVTVKQLSVCPPMKCSMTVARQFFEDTCAVTSLGVERREVALYVLTATGYWEMVDKRTVGKSA